FIPAGAGNTVCSHVLPVIRMVYPRWRGEHKARNFYSALDPGLSPLARGTHNSQINIYFVRRFIPAGAGNTTNRDLSAVSLPVYPRWRGEHTKHT
ncbi:hypothetical protein HMPREF1610_04982, partial [Escherichia coli 908555]